VERLTAKGEDSEEASNKKNGHSGTTSAKETRASEDQIQALTAHQDKT
jgi:hypothetical protein